MKHLLNSWAIGVLALSLWACSARPATSPEQAFERLREARGAGRSIFPLLDDSTRSMVAVSHGALVEAHGLISEHYPPARRARALQRVADGFKSKSPAAYFAKLVALGRLVLPPQTMGPATSIKREARRATVRFSGGTSVFCKNSKRWGYCGLAKPLEEIKLRAFRELKSVKDNVAFFRGARAQ